MKEELQLGPRKLFSACVRARACETKLRRPTVILLRGNLRRQRSQGEDMCIIFVVFGCPKNEHMCFSCEGLTMILVLAVNGAARHVSRVYVLHAVTKQIMFVLFEGEFTNKKQFVS